MPTCPICGESAYGPIHQKDADPLQMPTLYAHRHYGRVYLHEIEWIEPNSDVTIIEQ